MAGFSVKLASLLVLCMVFAMPMATRAITCSQVTGTLAPCLAYLTNKGTVTPTCCNGVKSLNSAAKTTADRQAICNCLKAALTTGINISKAAGLPAICKVSIPYKISPSTNCNSIK